MRKYGFGIVCWLLTASLVIFVAGCGRETVIVPFVVSTIPANGATDVVVNTPISATFSEGMNPATLSAATFTLTGGGRSRRTRSSYVYRHNSDIYAGFSSGIWDAIYSDDQRMPRWGYKSGRHSYDCQLRVDVHDDYAGSHSDCDGSCEWGHRRAH